MPDRSNDVRSLGQTGSDRPKVKTWLLPLRTFDRSDCAQKLQKSPVTGESTKETVKTIARGMPGDSGVTVVTMLVCFVLFCTRGWARRAPGIPCALI
jgi:hypothetical protein